MACDPNTLIEEAKCVQACIPPHMIQAATLAALCRFNAAAASNPSLTDIVAYWKMDEAGSVNRLDATGNGHTLVVNGTVNSGAGKINNAASSTGVPTDFLDCADTVFSGAPPFTAFAWINPSFIGFNFSILGHFSTGLLQGWRIREVATNNFALSVNNVDLINPEIISAGTFFLVIVTIEAGQRSIRVNNGADFSGVAIVPSNPAINFRVCGVSPGGDFPGSIDEVGIYNRVLTSAEKDALWNAGAGKQYPFT